MLKGIDPLLTPELLKVLAEMGHGDEIVIADANFTATTLGRGKTVLPPTRHRRAAHVRSRAVAAAAGCGGGPAGGMHAGQRHAGGLPQRAAAPGARSAWPKPDGPHPSNAKPSNASASMRASQHAHAIVLTGELQPFANFLFKKGVIGEALVR